MAERCSFLLADLFRKISNSKEPSEEFQYADEDSIEESLLCSICSRPFVDPVYHVECGNTFCKVCLGKVDKCPHCRMKLIKAKVMPSPKLTTTLLDKLKVRFFAD